MNKILIFSLFFINASMSLQSSWKFSCCSSSAILNNVHVPGQEEKNEEESKKDSLLESETLPNNLIDPSPIRTDTHLAEQDNNEISRSISNEKEIIINKQVKINAQKKLISLLNYIDELDLSFNQENVVYESEDFDLYFKTRTTMFCYIELLIEDRTFKILNKEDITHLQEIYNQNIKQLHHKPFCRKKDIVSRKSPG